MFAYNTIGYENLTIRFQRSGGINSQAPLLPCLLLPLTRNFIAVDFHDDSWDENIKLQEIRKKYQLKSAFKVELPNLVWKTKQARLVSAKRQKPMSVKGVAHDQQVCIQNLSYLRLFKGLNLLNLNMIRPLKVDQFSKNEPVLCVYVAGKKWPSNLIF